jgi:hypothetical protein
MLKRLLNQQVSLPSLTIGRLIAALSVLGIIGLAYLYGAAVMFFQLPSFVFLHGAFEGARAWHERGQSTIPELSWNEAEIAKKAWLRVDQAEKTSDGFTLYVMTDGARATLIDMRGTEVHRWELPFSRAWSHPPHIDNPLADDLIYWFHCHLYPNGGLLAIYHADGDTPYGYGLVKVDKDSKLLWAYPGRVHHDVDVGEDGTIYTLVHQIVREPPVGLEFLPTPYLTDSLIVLSPEGRELQNIPVLEAFANSPYALDLTMIRRGVLGYGLKGTLGANASAQRGMTVSTPLPTNDVLHTNSVKVLSQARAAKFPLFKPGQVLLSVRNLSTIAVLDRQTRSVAWAAQGPWQIQHDAEFLDNGHLLLYDNFGVPKQTRILELDPLTHALLWAYCNEDSTPFSAEFRGMKQRLSNGNTFIVDPDQRRVFEVTPNKKVVWEFYCPLPPASTGQRPKAHAINCARRYGADELTFLKGVARARP